MLWSRQGVKEACNCRSSKKEMTCVTFIGYWITWTPVWTLMCSLQSTKLTLLLLGGHRALPPRLLSPLSNGIRFIRSPQRLKLETTRRASDSSVFETGYQSPRRRVRGLQSPRKAFGNGLSTVAWCPRPLLPSAPAGPCLSEESPQELERVSLSQWGQGEDLNPHALELENQWHTAL